MLIAERVATLGATLRKNLGMNLVTPKISILVIRIAMGVLFLKAGLDKIFDDGWTASGYLLNAAEGPFTGFMEIFANNSSVDYLVMWGEVAIGIALILGAATRWTVVAVGLMMALFYISQLPPRSTVGSATA